MGSQWRGFGIIVGFRTRLASSKEEGRARNALQSERRAGVPRPYREESTGLRPATTREIADTKRKGADVLRPYREESTGLKTGHYKEKAPTKGRRYEEYLRQECASLMSSRARRSAFRASAFASASGFRARMALLRVSALDGASHDLTSPPGRTAVMSHFRQLNLIFKLWL